MTESKKPTFTVEEHARLDKLNQAADISDLVLKLVDGYAGVVGRDILFEMHDQAKKQFGGAFPTHDLFWPTGEAAEKILSNPATVPLMLFFLHCLGRFNDQLRDVGAPTTTETRAAFASAFYITKQPDFGNPVMGRPRNRHAETWRHCNAFQNFLELELSQGHTRSTANERALRSTYFLQYGREWLPGDLDHNNMKRLRKMIDGEDLIWE